MFTQVRFIEKRNAKRHVHISMCQNIETVDIEISKNKHRIALLSDRLSIISCSVFVDFDVRNCCFLAWESTANRVS